MSSEQTKPPAGREFISDDPFRSVSIKRVKSTTFITASCNVNGSLSFIRTDKSTQGLRLIRLLGLQPPEPFSDGIAVFGLRGAVLDALRNDQEMVGAVDALLKTGTRLTLQKNKLVATSGKSGNAAAMEALSPFVRAAAVRIEKLAGESVNDEIGADRLGRPYTMLSVLAGVVFGLSLGLLKPTLTPLTIALYSLGAALPFAVLAVGLVLPLHLRKNALGGAVVLNATIASLIASLMLGASLAMSANTCLGERLLAAQDIHVTGTIGVTRGKHTSCWLVLDYPSTDLVPGESLSRLPLYCNEVHFHANPVPEDYDVKLNPGLLGAPFVQSIQKLEQPGLEPQYAPASAMQCHYGLPAAGLPGLPPQNLSAVVRASLDAQGTVTDVVLEKSSGNSMFDELALGRSRVATCKPFVDQDGKAVPVETNFLFNVPRAELRPDAATITLSAKIARRVRANLVWDGPITDLKTTISVRCGPDGKLLSASIVHWSGNPAWDAAALAAVEHADPMPTDNNGKSLEHFTITLRPGPA
jgi:TonB family protein